ncbi:hypothetical protein EH223_18800 [candidate division KSB1 bacterium]|nr:hypothetical protein [candidate division KSB1 bacterium]RQW00354.1 MAG: hypothetical protein EH223_18800 [candidate division KSB1 bacterium]
MRHAAVEEWEKRLDQVMHELDAFLEEQYAGTYVLHPARPLRGRTANPSHDGLFNIAANFTLGLGSKIGKGYVVDIRLVTLEHVSAAVRDEIEDAAMQQLMTLIPKHFPDTHLQVKKDGPVVKIFGDLSLGKA